MNAAVCVATCSENFGDDVTKGYQIDPWLCEQLAASIVRVCNLLGYSSILEPDEAEEGFFSYGIPMGGVAMFVLDPGDKFQGPDRGFDPVYLTAFAQVVLSELVRRGWCYRVTHMQSRSSVELWGPGPDPVEHELVFGAGKLDVAVSTAAAIVLAVDTAWEKAGGCGAVLP